VLATSLRPTDLIARFGGEEFAALLPSATTDQAVLAAERVRRTLAGRPVLVENDRDTSVELTLSVGVAQLRAGDTLQSLVAAADSALYRAKSTGRNRVQASAR
jgi:diguanylate cyclase (GGDEF)-like protein